MVPFLRPARRVYSRESSLTGVDRKGEFEETRRDGGLAAVLPGPPPLNTSRGEPPMGEIRLRRTPGRGVPAVLAAFACFVLAGAPSVSASSDRSTFSIVAYDSVTQELGVAVQSKYFSVGTDVPWAEAGVGAVATQARVDPSFGPKALALLRTGLSAPEVLRALAATDSVWDSRH